ncbi:MAG: DUF4197 domain-containing protein [Desulfobia sp.]
MKRTIFFFMMLILVPRVSGAGFGDIVNKTAGFLSGGSEKTVSTSLSKDEITAGIKEALQVSAERAVKQASREGGFNTNPSIHIPPPKHIAAIKDKLRYIGLSGQADTFENTMNTAAEKASEKALPILGQAVRNMGLKDVEKVWQGGETAATQYLREKTWEDIYDEFQPVISAQTKSVGVTSAYKDLTESPSIRTLVSQTGFDLDHYITKETMEGLFFLLGREEQEIRNNPAARSTEILKKVFGGRSK